MGLTQITTGGVDDNINIDSNTLKVDGTNNRVGIGTATPSSKLDVNGPVKISPDTAGKDTFTLTTNAANDGRFLVKADTTTKVDIQANGASYFNGGSVGIGTSSPATKLDITGPGTANASTLRINDAASSADSRHIHLARSSASAYIGVAGSQAGDPFFISRTGANNDLVINSSGNIGIGTTQPGAKLDVIGEVQCDSLDVDGIANIDGRLTVIDRVEAYAPGNGDYAFSGYGSGSSGNSHLFRGATSGGTVVASIMDNGSAEFASNVEVGGNSSSGSEAGCFLHSAGFVAAARSSSSDAVWRSFVAGNSTEKISFTAGGAATFASDVTALGYAAKVGAGPNALVFSGYQDANASTLTSSIDRNGSAAFGVGTAATSNAPGVNIYKNNSNASYPTLYLSQGSTSGNLITGHNAGTGQVTFTLGSDGDAVFAGTITDSLGSLRRVAVDNVTGVSGNLAASDAGKLLRVSSSSITLTVPSGTYSAGDMITFFNVSTTNLTIAQGSSTTIYNSADGATGNRTLAAKGLATLVCTASNEFVISGTQLS